MLALEPSRVLLKSGFGVMLAGFACQHYPKYFLSPATINLILAVTKYDQVLLQSGSFGWQPVFHLPARPAA